MSESVDMSPEMAGVEESVADVRDVGLDLIFPDLPDSPSFHELNAWKEEFGNTVFAFPLGEGEQFVFRSLTRSDWMRIRMLVQQAVAEGKQVDDDEVAKIVVDTCVLWASELAVDAFEHKAGTMDTVHEVIRLYSNFVNPMAAAQSVIRL